MIKYEIIKELGSGTGTVINLCKKNDSYVVLKELVDSHYFDNLEDEQVVLSKLSPHKHISNLQESFIFGKKIYLEYEYYSQGDLYDFIKTNGTLNESKALILLSQLTSALLHAKMLGYYHCDVKPENILLRTQNEFVLCDWDLVRKVKNTSSSLHYGSSLSMAPEVMLGQISSTSDVYSLGCLIYFCLFGERVFNLKTSESKYGIVLKHLENIPKLPSNSLSNGFKELLTWMLYKDPKQRVTLEEIKNFLDGKKNILRKDNVEVYKFVQDIISKENLKKNQLKSLKKYEQYKDKYEKELNKSDKNLMLAHLIILAYLDDKRSQKILSEIYQEGTLLEKNSKQAKVWLDRSSIEV